jgi:hypothetical protein
MATLNTAATPSTEAADKRRPSHYINVNVVKADGKLLKLGAIPVYADSADKAQRTLIDAVTKNPDFDCSKLDILIDVRENVKSTEVDDINGWNMVDRVVITTSAA